MATLATVITAITISGTFTALGTKEGKVLLFKEETHVPQFVATFQPGVKCPISAVALSKAEFEKFIQSYFENFLNFTEFSKKCEFFQKIEKINTKFIRKVRAI